LRAQHSFFEAQSIMKLSVFGLFAATSEAKLQAVGPAQFKFELFDIEVHHVEGEFVSIAVPDAPVLRFKGEPALPVFREAVILPHELGEWTAKVTNIQTSLMSLDGRKVTPSMGAVPVCSTEVNGQTNMTASAYHGQYPKVEQVLLEEPYQWRDVHGAVLQVLPVSVDHDAGTMQVLKSCNIELVSTKPAPVVAPKVVDPDFHAVYSSVYSNFEHFADRFVRDVKMGRTLIVHEPQFKRHAQDYADFVKQRWSQDSILFEASG